MRTDRNEWKGHAVEPLRPHATRMIDPLTSQPNGRYRAVVLGGATDDPTMGRRQSTATGPVCFDEAAALETAAEFIARRRRSMEYLASEMGKVFGFKFVVEWNWRRFQLEARPKDGTPVAPEMIRVFNRVLARADD